MIEAEGLSKRFGSTQALAGVDLEVPEGTVLALLGPNGAGKTTLVRILTTLLKPDAGRARVAGYDVVADAAPLRSAIGLAGGGTVLLTTQYMEEAERLADRIVVLDAGSVIAEGTSEQLKERLGGDLLEVRVADAEQLAPAAALIAEIAGGDPNVDPHLRR